MVGFKKDNLKVEDLVDDIDDDFEDDDYDEDEVVEEVPVVKDKPKGKSGVVRPDKKKEKDKDKNAYIAIGGVALVVLFCFGFFILSKMKPKEVIEELPIIVIPEEDDISVGMPTLTGTPTGDNTSDVTNIDDFMISLSGTSIPVVYTVEETETITDFINYTKYRSIMGQGLEFYWLEATYKGIPYKVQVPYSIYSKLEDTGITVVDAEVLTLDSGEQVITYMNVRKDAKAILAR